MSLSNDATANVCHNQSQRRSSENFGFQIFVNMLDFSWPGSASQCFVIKKKNYLSTSSPQ